MELNTPNPTKIATKWGFINLLFQVIITYAIQLLNIDAAGPVKFIAYLPLIACLLLAQKEFKDEQLGGYITFSQAFSAGFRFAIFAGLLVAVFMYLYLAFLNQNYLVQSFQAAKATMAEKGMSDAGIQKAENMTLKWGPLFSAFGIAIWYAIFGAIVSLVGAAIFKKEKSRYEDDDTLQDVDATV